MDRRAFLGLAGIAGLFPAAVLAEEEGPSLPTSIPGYPQYKVLHFHFDAGVMPEIEWNDKYGTQLTLVPTFCFDNTGRVCSMRMEKELGVTGEHRVVPLSHSGAQKGLIENMQIMAKCLAGDKNDKSKYVSLVTSKGSDGVVYQVGICATPWRPRRPSWPTWL